MEDAQEWPTQDDLFWFSGDHRWFRQVDDCLEVMTGVRTRFAHVFAEKFARLKWTHQDALWRDGEE